MQFPAQAMAVCSPAARTGGTCAANSPGHSRSMRLPLLFTALLTFTASAQEPATPTPEAAPAPARKEDGIVKLWHEGAWQGAMPGGWKPEGEETSEKTAHMGGTLAVKNVAEPALHYYKPAAPGTRAVIICPGGGYHILAWDLEGTEVAEWLNRQNIHAFVLKYRLPRGNEERHAAALQDAQRAISFVRSQAQTYGLAQDQIGIMGFSAGAHLSALAATQFKKRSYDGRDAIDTVSCRPDFAGLIYPAYILKDQKDPASGLHALLPAGADTPPAFLVHAMDDPLPCANSMAWVLAMQPLKVTAELHIYPDGGHGYGLRSDKSVKAWPAQMATWLARGAK
jgi:acetyl esterase/lipase